MTAMLANASSVFGRVRPQYPQSATESATTATLPVLYVPAAARDRAIVRDRLVRAGAAVSVAADAPDAIQMLGTRRFSLVVVDLATERTALTTVRLIRAQFPLMTVVGVIDPAQPLVASEAIAAGVAELLPWPFDERDVAAMLAAVRDAEPVNPSPGRADLPDRLFEHSMAMRLVADALRAAATPRTGVLLCGEPGSGRHMLARTLHERDHDVMDGPFIGVDCAEGGANDLERRLFGDTGDSAEAGRPGSPERVARGGAVVAAQGGSLFLTNILDAPARVQARLARVLGDRAVVSIDLQETIALTFRVIVSAGPAVDAAIDDGRLRRDLLEQIAQVRIDVPPLRNRREDVPLLAAHFLQRACDAESAGPMRFSRAALALLCALPWPGNAAELQRVVAATVRSARQPVIQLDDVLEHARMERPGNPQAARDLPLREARAQFEREWISATLVRHNGRVGDAAKALGLQRTNLYRKVRQLRIPRALLVARK